MRPIFRPSVRVKVACPSRVGCGTLAGRTKSGFSSAAEGLYDFDLFALGSVLRGLGNELAPEFEASSVPVTTFLGLEADVWSAGRAASSLGFFAAAVCDSRAAPVPIFSFCAGFSAALSLRLLLADRTGSEPNEFP